MATINITTSMGTININNNTEQTINPNTELLNNNPQNVYIPTKVCSTCHTIKYITEFQKRKEAPDGYRSQCKNCLHNHNKEYMKENKDQIVKYKKEYYQQHKHKINEQLKEYREQHKDSKAAYMKNYNKKIKIKKRISTK